MASLATLRANTLIYLGTTSSDKAFPPATLDFCINNAVSALYDDITEANPSWSDGLVTLTSTTHDYTLPSDFSKWIEVRLDDKDGVALTEVRQDELNSTSGYVFALVGPDHATTLTTGDTIPVGNSLYFKYRGWPADLVLTTDQPDNIPRKYHDLIALYAAEEAMGLGGEGALPSTLIRRKEDRHGQLMMHVARRGSEVMSVRGSAAQWDDE